jgi:hypothetical protein
VARIKKTKQPEGEFGYIIKGIIEGEKDWKPVRVRVGIMETKWSIPMFENERDAKSYIDDCIKYLGYKACMIVKVAIS